MAETKDQPDQPLTPAGRLFFQRRTEQIINCSIALEHPLDIPAIRATVVNSVMFKHPRFCSLMVQNSRGRQKWRKTTVDVDRHIIILPDALSDSCSDSDAVNDYVADLAVSSPLATDKPLWEIHLLLAHKTMVFRLHHALGDGISLMSLLMTCCRRADDPEKLPEIGGVGAAAAAGRRRLSLMMVLKVIWYSLIYILEFLLRVGWMKDRATVISGGAGVEMWPRKVATARFRIEDMKAVKGTVANATINDVLLGIISSGLSKYLDIRSSKPLREGLKLTGAVMVNLRPQAGLQDLAKLMDNKDGTRFGNKFGMLLLPLYYHKGGSDPIDFVRRAKSMVDKKKLSLEAPFSYRIGYLIMWFFGAKFASILNYRIICNTTFTISNVVGPREEITLVDNLVKSIRVASSGLPHAITMHMVSYAGVADLQIQVAKELVPEPKILAKCFENALSEMKEAAETKNIP